MKTNAFFWFGIVSLTLLVAGISGFILGRGFFPSQTLVPVAYSSESGYVYEWRGTADLQSPSPYFRLAFSYPNGNFRTTQDETTDSLSIWFSNYENAHPFGGWKEGDWRGSITVVNAKLPKDFCSGPEFLEERTRFFKVSQVNSHTCRSDLKGTFNIPPESIVDWGRVTELGGYTVTSDSRTLPMVIGQYYVSVEIYEEVSESESVEMLKEIAKTFEFDSFFRQ